MKPLGVDWYSHEDQLFKKFPPKSTVGDMVKVFAEDQAIPPNPISAHPGNVSEYSCCKLHFTRYVNDGPSRSTKLVTELMCSGQCGPARLLPNAIGHGKWWRPRGPDFCCIPTTTAPAVQPHARVRCAWWLRASASASPASTTSRSSRTLGGGREAAEGLEATAPRLGCQSQPG
ncbi:hypothetical protein P7K49_002298 [Saguinus oedipus]|uniref:Sclerostin n=1 Tax=Saguinus oedipus TaxID=9490 RepID=A0ABQ9WGY5_SAGOE|nr:hypothetical protein P7K49_002298 [Saguinus oedipus]